MKSLLILLVFCLFEINALSFKSPSLKNNVKWKTMDGNPTVLMGHQGDKFLMPEHSLGSYELAAILGADFIEPDLVLTKDNVLVCYHDLTLKGGTNVANFKEFEDRMRNFTDTVNGTKYNYLNDWFIEDFTFDELQMLNIFQRKTGIRSQFYNEIFKIPTFDQYLQLISKMSKGLKRKIGLIPEVKHPKYHNRNKREYYFEDLIVEKLREYGYPINTGDEENCESGECGNVIIQCFDPDSLYYFRQQSDQLELMLLVHPIIELLTYKRVEEVSKFANYLSVQKEYLYTGVEAEIKYRNYTVNWELIDSLGGFIPADQFVPVAHSHGMKMTVWTINDSREDSNHGCASNKGCDPNDKEAEMFLYFKQGCDAIFVENIAESRELRIKFDQNIKDFN